MIAEMKLCDDLFPWRMVVYLYTVCDAAKLELSDQILPIVL
jgi:hypothetical protein